MPTHIKHLDPAPQPPISRFARSLPMDRLSGLRPQAWVCVGAGFAREDVKTLVLKGPGGPSTTRRGFVAEAVTTIQEICVRWLASSLYVRGAGEGVPISKEDVLGSLARQEVLRLLLADSRISSGMKELKRLRRQGGFYKRVDQAIQQGRLTFLHEQEELVYAERLTQLFGENPVRDEVRALTLAYEAWMQASRLWDLPLLMKEVMKSDHWPESVSMPEEIYVYSAQTPEVLEFEFWRSLSRFVRIVYVGQKAASGEEPTFQAKIRLQRWHTLDDAADVLADILAGAESLRDHAVLMPDQPSVRRSLRRALDARGIPLADPRDPTRLRTEEALKWAMLPLDVVARGFDRQHVVSWMRGYLDESRFSQWSGEIAIRGIRSGLSSYTGSKLADVHSELTVLNQQLGGRRTCAELADAHLAVIKKYRDRNSARFEGLEKFDVVEFFENLWKSFVADTERVEFSDRRAPLLYWLERLQVRIAEATPPVERLKAENGLEIFRLQQAPLQTAPNLWLFGVPANWLAGESIGDYWFTEREREVLATEFQVRSAIQSGQERREILREWVANASQVTFLDGEYDAAGRERESVYPVLRELGVAAPDGASASDGEDSTFSHGSHPKWAASYGALRPVPPQNIQLSAMAGGPGGALPVLTATQLDRYSRCPFQALAFHRWNLRDAREPDTELWPDVRGNILHLAVKLLLGARDENGNFTILPREALEQAWLLERPKGLLSGDRVERYVKSRLVLVLDAFCAKEREYVNRSGARVISLDDQALRLEGPGFAVVGQPDRIDEGADGLFIQDYKTSSAQPHGAEMLELGYRLQLPFYALAAQRKMQKPVLGVQFIELSRRASRSSGMFFKAYNGKDPGKFSNVTARSKSLLALDPADAWAQCFEHITAHAQAYLNGRFDAKPKKKEKECSQCSVSDLCGRKRLGDNADTEGASAGSSEEGSP